MTVMSSPKTSSAGEGRSRLHEVVERRVIGEIASGEIAEGEWLPREVDMADRYEVSRGVARETVQGLRARGVVEVRHGRGTWVLPEERWDLLDPQLLVALVIDPSRRDLLREVLECRETLESEAAGLASERSGEREREQLAAAFEAMRAAFEGAQPENPGDAVRAVAHRGLPEDAPQVRAEAAFHGLLVALARNRPLRRMLQPLHLALAVVRYELVSGREEATLAQHERILAAVAGGDAAAAREAVRAHAAELARWLRLSRRR